ncbi:MAG: hypothetical protein E6Q66_10100 [Pedobacter sp.]|jgi:hypothetical protein|nr:MAG: hypothetical protein E6Q66_10100 [Pedobacter sp.]
MYFRFSDFYKRDTAFAFSEEKNQFDLYTLPPGLPLKVDKPIEFEVDKIDSYIESYDLLPTHDTPLVSARFKKLFEYLTNDLQFVNTVITDKKNNRNESFYYLNILNVLPLMDKNKSVFEIEIYGKTETMNIKKLYIIEESLKTHSIVRMEENDAYIIVTEEFKKRCEEAHLKGINFIEEGHSIYTDL